MLENSSNEGRNCCSSQNSCMQSIPTYSFNFTSNISESDCESENMTRKEMLCKIRSLKFAIVEISEYLDTHEDDKKAIYLHKKYTNELEDLKDKYQRMFGPLTIYFPCNKWRWIEEPWPWEGGDF